MQDSAIRRSVNCGPSYQRMSWGRTFVAALIGIGVYISVVFFLTLFIILMRFVFNFESALPPTFFLGSRLLITFVSAAAAGSLVNRFGWLIGALTQVIVILAVAITIIALLAISGTTASEFPAVATSDYCLVITGLLAASVGGAFGQKYRRSIWVFLQTVYAVIGSGVYFVSYAAGSIFYLYCLYRGGKELFEHGAVLKAALWLAVIGPVASGLLSLLLIGTFLVGAWLYQRLYNWYSPYIGLDHSEVGNVFDD